MKKIKSQLSEMPMQVTLTGDTLKIEVGVNSLVKALTDGRRYGLAGVKVTDRSVFLETLRGRLTYNCETGASPVYDILDSIVGDMVENGEPGVDFDEN